MKNEIFTGIATALITPLTKEGINYDAFGKLIDWQIDEGVKALVICGTTGESSTLTDEEHRAAIAYAVERANKRVPIIAGTGSNDTDYAIDLTKFSCNVGADAVLVVTPYYNKATQNGLIKMYEAIADASSVPMILYNVPSRTGCNILPKTVATLADHPKIAAIKEASGDISQIAQVFAYAGDKIDVYSGNDDQIVPILSLGGKGCISVLSNVAPKASQAICDAYFSGDIKKAAELQIKYLPLINALFSEVNPIPVKAAMSAMGWCEDFLRMPLTSMEDAHREVLLNEMRKLAII